MALTSHPNQWASHNQLAILLLVIVCSSYAFEEGTTGIRKYSEEEYLAFLEQVDIDTTPDSLDVARDGGLDVDFDCPILPPSREVPSSVHRLRPGDVNVIAALGDSITAGNGAGALTLIGCMFNYRGRSFSIGGSKNIDTFVTLPNILKLYNPDLKGYSTGMCGYESWCAKLNYAVAGAIAQDVYEQATDLINEMKDDSSIDFVNDWKVITLFIGGNDLCDYCEDITYFSAQAYVQAVKRTLDLLHNEVPRVFVNVIQVVEVVEIAQVAGFLCDIMHAYFCECAIDQYKELVHNATKQYQVLLDELVNSGRYDTRDDFTVVLQPFLEETIIPLTDSGQPDLSYFAPDCFHFSSKGHSAAAQALWNNMLEPVHQKKRQWVINEPFECPSVEQPYLYTRENSVNVTERYKKGLGHMKKQGEPTAVIGSVSPSHHGWQIIVTAVTVIGGLIVLLIVFIIVQNKSLFNRNRTESLSLVKNEQHEMIDTPLPIITMR